MVSSDKGLPSYEPSCVPLISGWQHNKRPWHHFTILYDSPLQLLNSKARCINYYAKSFSTVFSGSWLLLGLRDSFFIILFWWSELLLTFTCSLLLLSSHQGRAPLNSNRTGQRWTGSDGKDHHYDAHVSQDVWRKQGTRAVCQLMARYAVLKNGNIFVLGHVVQINDTVWHVSNLFSTMSDKPAYLLGWWSTDVKMGK